jgi:hypothetical protein
VNGHLLKIFAGPSWSTWMPGLGRVSFTTDGIRSGNVIFLSLKEFFVTHDNQIIRQFAAVVAAQLGRSRAFATIARI